MEGDKNTGVTDNGAPIPLDDTNVPRADEASNFSENLVTETETLATSDPTSSVAAAAANNDAPSPNDSAASPPDTAASRGSNDPTSDQPIEDKDIRKSIGGKNSKGSAADTVPTTSTPGAFRSSGTAATKPDRALRNKSDGAENKQIGANSGAGKVGAEAVNSIPSREERKLARMRARDPGTPEVEGDNSIQGEATDAPEMLGVELQAELVEEVDHRALIQKEVAEQTEAMRRELQAENERIRRESKTPTADIVEETSSNSGTNRKRVVIGFLVVAAIVIGAYFGTNGFQSSSKATEAPDTSSSSQLFYSPPSPDDCLAIANGETVTGQDDMNVNGYLVILEMIYSGEISFDSLSAGLRQKIQEVVMPILAGCEDNVDGPTGTAGGNRWLRNNLQTIQEMKAESSHRSLNTNPNRYAIGNGRSFLPSIMDDETCENAPGANETCSVIALPVDLYLKDDSLAFLTATSLLQDAFGGDLISLLDLQNTAILELKLREIDIRDQTQSPSVAPSGYPSSLSTLNVSITPSASVAPSGIPNDLPASNDPSFAPSLPPSELSSDTPSAAPSGLPSFLPAPNAPEPSQIPIVTPPPTPGPTPEPTPNPTPPPTPGPTPQPTPGPTPPPAPDQTPSPTLGPTLQPTPDPTPGPTPDPTPDPTPVPTPNPTPGPTLNPTPGPTPNPTPVPTPNPTPSPTLNPTPGPTPIPTPLPTKSPTSKWERILAGHEPYHPEAFAWVSTVDTWEPDPTAANADEQCLERYAMAALYYSFVSTDNSYQSSWMRSDLHHCDWSSTHRCDGSNTVDWMNIEDDELGGTFPTEYGLLTHLTSLNFELNDLEGVIPSEMGRLTLLTYLNLAECKFTGSIPTEIGLLSKLTFLKLNQNQLTGQIPNTVGSLSQVKYFNLFTNQLSGTIPKALGSMVQLTYLDIEANYLSGSIPNEVKNLLALRELQLSNNTLTGQIPDTIGSLSLVKHFNVFSNQLSGTIPSAFGSMVQLTLLALDSNDLTGQIPSEIENLSALRELHLSNNNLGGTLPSEMGAMMQLSEFQLWGNNVGGTIPSELGLLPLTYLDLSTNQLTGQIPVLPTSLFRCYLAESYLVSERNCFTDVEGTPDTSNAGVCTVVDNCLSSG